MSLPVKYELDGLLTWARIFSSNSPAFPAAAGAAGAAAGGAAVAALGGLFSFWTRTHVVKSVYKYKHTTYAVTGRAISAASRF